MNFPTRKKKCQDYLERKDWVRIGDGRSRTVYCKTERMDYILKVPKLSEAQKENRREADLSKIDERYAHSRLIDLFSIDCLLMECLSPLMENMVGRAYDYNVPDWIHKMDCQQVGRNEFGDWRAYDFPDDPLNVSDMGSIRDHDEIVEAALKNKN